MNEIIKLGYFKPLTTADLWWHCAFDSNAGIQATARTRSGGHHLRFISARVAARDSTCSEIAIASPHNCSCLWSVLWLCSGFPFYLHSFSPSSSNLHKIVFSSCSHSFWAPWSTSSAVNLRRLLNLLILGSSFHLRCSWLLLPSRLMWICKGATWTLTKISVDTFKCAWWVAWGCARQSSLQFTRKRWSCRMKVVKNPQLARSRITCQWTLNDSWNWRPTCTFSGRGRCRFPVFLLLSISLFCSCSLFSLPSTR